MRSDCRFVIDTQLRCFSYTYQNARPAGNKSDWKDEILLEMFSGCVILRVICLKVIWRKEGKSFLMWNISSIAVLCWELSFADRPGQKNCIVMTWSSWNIAPTRDRSMMKDIFLSRCYFTTLVSLLILVKLGACDVSWRLMFLPWRPFHVKHPGGKKNQHWDLRV